MKANPWILSCFIGSHISISCFHNFLKNSNGHVLISTLAEDEFLRFLFNWLTVISVSHLSNSFSDLLSRLKIKFIKKIILLPLAFFFFAFFLFLLLGFSCIIPCTWVMPLLCFFMDFSKNLYAYYLSFNSSKLVFWILIELFMSNWELFYYFISCSLVDIEHQV